MYNTKIGQFCAMHKDWREILSEAPYFLKIEERDNYVLFKYSQIDSDFSSPIVQEARGIVFGNGDWTNPACWAFNKFFNYKEPFAADIDWSTAFITEKIDGSLCKLWFDKRYWRISTNRLIDAFQAPIAEVKAKEEGILSFGHYFIKAVEKYYKTFEDFTKDLDATNTYMFELTGPYNRVVIPYTIIDIHFLGARNKYTGEQYPCNEFFRSKFHLDRIPVPKQYPLTSLDDCLSLIENFGWDQEGFVVVDQKGNRVKIKSSAYVLAHFMRNNNIITRKHLLKILLDNEIEEFLCYTEDYKDELFKLQELIEKFHNRANLFAEQCQSYRNLSDRDYAKIVNTYPKIFQPFLFINRKQDLSIKDFTQGWTVNKWDSTLTQFETLD